jgi:hypothetical protein
MRFHAEYQFSISNINGIHFNYTNGTIIPFEKWTKGYRPIVKGNKVNWVKNASSSKSYETFKSYLWNIFNYAGSLSLSKELQSISTLNEIKIGDVFIVGGSPGHAVTVIDIGIHETTNEKIFLLCQSYMPAQEIHILKNFNNTTLSPWYSINFGEELKTPEWTFYKNNLMRFKD